MHHDILLKPGSDYSTRSSLYNFIIEKLRKLELIHSHRISSLRVTLENNKATLLNFIHELDNKFIQLSESSGLSVESLWSMCELVRCSVGSDRYAIKSIPLIDIFGDQFDEIESKVLMILEQTHQASSCCENINGRVGGRLKTRQNITQKSFKRTAILFKSQTFSSKFCS